MTVTPEQSAGTQQRHRRQVDDGTERGERVAAVTHEVPVVLCVYRQADGEKTSADETADATENVVAPTPPVRSWAPVDPVEQFQLSPVLVPTLFSANARWCDGRRRTV